MRASSSDTPLVRKLGIKTGFRIAAVDAPVAYRSLVPDMPEGVSVKDNLDIPLDMVHLFTKDRDHLRIELPILKRSIKQNGMIWVSWPKRSSGIETNVNGNVIRDVCLPMGLVDVKVCSVSNIWSALKLVIRVENRSD